MKILLGMSGGLDSTYSAKKLMDAGHTVVGAVLKMHCFTDVDSALAAAHALGIQIVVINCEDSFDKNVRNPFAHEYYRGRTPNPCIICNSTVKFRKLCDYARENGFDAIATGHYAHVECDDGRYFITVAKDKKKDQSYVLYRLGQDILSKLLLPLGDMEKSDVRELSRIDRLPSADAEESQEICFIGGENYCDYLEREFGKSDEGDFIDENGNVLGRHKGIIHYTVGQRKGLGIALGKRMFVSSVNPEKNTITLTDVQRSDRCEIHVDDIVFSGMKEAKGGEEIKVGVRLRYQSPILEATVKFLSHNSAKVVIIGSSLYPTPGQSAVFYDSDRVMFGGFIR